MSKKPTEQSLITEIPTVSISFDAEAFDSALRSQGVRLIHYKAMRCPVGMSDLDDNRRPHADHAGCSNGFLYKKAGSITGLLIGNSNSPRLTDIGFVEGASFQTTFPRSYDDDNCGDKPFYPAPFDRFYLDEESIVVTTWQLVKANASGRDKVAFPIVEVEELIDNAGIYYKCGTDYRIKDGLIEWLPTGSRPMPDLETGMGAIYSIRYVYRPFWYVARMLHEIRVTQVDNPLTNERKIVRMPQSCLLNREFLYLNEQNDSEATDPRSSRQQLPPDDGGFGR